MNCSWRPAWVDWSRVWRLGGERTIGGGERKCWRERHAIEDGWCLTGSSAATLLPLTPGREYASGCCRPLPGEPGQQGGVLYSDWKRCRQALQCYTETEDSSHTAQCPDYSSTPRQALSFVVAPRRPSARRAPPAHSVPSCRLPPRWFPDPCRRPSSPTHSRLFPNPPPPPFSFAPAAVVPDPPPPSFLPDPVAHFPQPAAAALFTSPPPLWFPNPPPPPCPSRTSAL